MHFISLQNVLRIHRFTSVWSGYRKINTSDEIDLLPLNICSKDSLSGVSETTCIDNLEESNLICEMPIGKYNLICIQIPITPIYSPLYKDELLINMEPCNNF